MYYIGRLRGGKSKMRKFILSQQTQISNFDRCAATSNWFGLQTLLSHFLWLKLARQYVLMYCARSLRGLESKFRKFILSQPSQISRCAATSNWFGLQTLLSHFR